MTLSDISIKNPVFAWMLMAALILFGFIAFRSLGVSQMPDVDFPVVTIGISYEGAAPEVVDVDVVDIIEQAVMTVQGIKSVSSTAREGQGTVSIEFELERDIDAAVQEVQTKISQVDSLLPRGIDRPVVTKANPEDHPIMWISLSADRPMREIMEYARDHIQDRLQTVSGVGEVILGGFVAPALRVYIDPEKLSAADLAVKDVLDAIEAEHVEAPAGRIETTTTEFNLRLLGEMTTPEEFGEILIQKRGGSPVFKPIPLKAVAKVEKGLDEVRRVSRTNGIPSIGLGIKKQRGSNAVAVADQVKERMADIRKTLREGYKLEINFDTTRFIRDNAAEMNFDLVLAAILTSVVCLLFLASWSATFNVLMAIPTSIVGSFLFLYFFGFTLNTFTLLGLILAIGIVVDDAIMVLENIVRHREMGKSPIEAARDGAREITPAAVAATLSIIAIFIPVVFMKGVIGKFFLQFGITMTVAVGLSLLEALTLTPMRASRLLATKRREGRFGKAVHGTFARVSGGYERALRFSLRHRFGVITASFAIFAASFVLLTGFKTPAFSVMGIQIPEFHMAGLRKEFVPAQDQSMFMIRLQTPLGSSIAHTDQKIREVEAVLATRAEVARYFVAIGGFGGGEVNTAIAFVSLKLPKDRPVDRDQGHRLSQAEIIDHFRGALGKIPDLLAIVQDLSTRGFTADRGFPVEFTIRGPEWDKLTQFTPQFMEEMKRLPYYTDIDTGYRSGQPEIQIAPNREAAARYGVSVDDIAVTVNAMIGGVRTENKFAEGGHRNEIRVRLREEARQSASDIENLKVRNYRGELVSMANLVKIETRDTLQSITRKDRERAIGIFANVKAGESQQVALDAVREIAARILPEGYRVVLTGSAETFKESFSDLVFALYLGVIVAYMILASQYNSFIHPVVVLLALPFSISGAWVGLRLFDNSLNIYSFIGLILLMGIVKKNSILLVDFTNQRRREGLSVRDALLHACPTRLRPILMTSIATIAAAVPPALAIGPGAETRIPMAIVVIGGVIFSTFLTLFVVPCAYSLMSRLEMKSNSP